MLDKINKKMNYSTCQGKKSFDAPFETFVNEEDLKGKVVVKSLKTRTIEPKDQFSKFNVSDFYMENLIAAGAAGNLKSCQYGDIDVDSFSANLDLVTDSMSVSE